MMPWIERLGKWRVFFAGWVFGSRPDTDGPARMIQDLVERTLILRAEVSALTRILVENGIEEPVIRAAIEEEARALCDALADRFPGFVAVDEGMHMTLPEAAETMQREGFPP